MKEMENDDVPLEKQKILGEGVPGTCLSNSDPKARDDALADNG